MKCDKCHEFVDTQHELIEFMGYEFCPECYSQILSNTKSFVKAYVQGEVE